MHNLQVSGWEITLIGRHTFMKYIKRCFSSFFFCLLVLHFILFAKECIKATLNRKKDVKIKHRSCQRNLALFNCISLQHMCTVHYPPDRLRVVFLRGIVLLSVKLRACTGMNSKHGDFTPKVVRDSFLLLIFFSYN